ncbi:protein ASPARTIC PROTEASE IN GUARD CELL 2-like [Corylus avellana]|uniref:protein ASPARTIC PROTEASE IN GUARD CELL 2-like n=1 Tax=Corylus avellana TaxID=13451 RepID=UPI00286B91EF|nr:protein ASPARTIC PROTEASE IN GUARD CELL 2-like [Corylus avellana]
MEFFCSHFGQYCSSTMLLLIILLHLLPLTTMDSSSPSFISAEIFPQTVGHGSYFTEIEVGTPPVSQFMVIHTGSDTTWFQCKPCDCDQTPGLGFDPLNSTSFSVVPCASNACNHLRQHGCNNNSQCQYEVDYLEGYSTNGSLVLETLTFGSTAIPSVFCGCGHSNYGMVAGSNGFVGLGGGPLSLPTQLRLRGLADIFNYCLPGLFGGPAGWLNFSHPGAVIPAGTAWIPLLRNPKTPAFYYVGLSGLGVGDVRLPIPENSFKMTKQGMGGVIIDSGTIFTKLPKPIYEVFRNAYIAKTINLPRAPMSPLFDMCYNLSGLELIQVPNVSFFFTAGPILTLKIRNILVEHESYIGERIFCFAFVPTNNRRSIIGNTQLIGIQTSFDTTAGYVGFGPNICSPPEDSPHCHGHWPPRSIGMENYITPNPLLLVCLFTCFYLLINTSV